jgi:predicted PurR-regulated permease PerM
LPQAVSEGAQWTAQEFPEFSEAIKKNLPKIREYFSENVSPAKITDLAKRLIKTTLSATGGLVSFFSFIAGFAVVPIYLYYMLTANCDFYTQLEKNLSRIGFLSESKREDIVFFVRRFVEIMVAFFRGQLLIALIMGLLIGCGLWIAGVKFGFLLGFCAGILNLIPYLGTIIGLGTIIPVSIFQDGGGWMLASISLAVFCAVQCLEGYVLTPRIMGDRTGLHPTVIIFSVFFWGIALHGILGMIFAIPFSAFIVCAWDRISNRWLAKD